MNRVYVPMLHSTLPIKDPLHFPKACLNPTGQFDLSYSVRTRLGECIHHAKASQSIVTAVASRNAFFAVTFNYLLCIHAQMIRMAGKWRTLNEISQLQFHIIIRFLFLQFLNFFLSSLHSFFSLFLFSLPIFPSFFFLPSIESIFNTS